MAPPGDPPLTDEDDDARLIALGAQVSDRQAVEWTRAESDAADGAARALVENLRELSHLIDAHRHAGAGQDDADDDDVDDEREKPVPRAAPWRHLVLLEELGRGAFGVVHRAWDTRLDREVALKLFDGAAGAAEPLKEARLLARIRHPHVVMVFGAEQEAGRSGVWMELIHGETLAALVAGRGPLSAREAVGVGIDLCRALSALHREGLLHRDVKAQNVMREVGGRIVLMDFSGADALVPAARRDRISGTPLYMAPELLDGASSSVGSDIYSLGVLLFYLLTGRHPVEGETLADIRAAHAAGERARLRDLRSDVPEPVVQVIERARHPDPAARYRTAGELEQALALTFTAQASEAGSATAPQAERRWKALAWTAGLIAVAAIAAAAIVAPWRSAPPLMVRARIGPPFNTATWPRISPDGRAVIFGTLNAEKPVLWIKRLADEEGAPLAGSRPGEAVFWSADSRHVAFFEDDWLKTLAVDGGAPQSVTRAPVPRGGDWNRDGTLIFSSGGTLHAVAADGTSRRQLTTLDTGRGEYQHSWPEFLPDGRRYLFVVRSKNPEQSGVFVGTLDAPTRTRVLPAYSRTVYAASGHLLFVRDGSLTAQRFDPGTLRLSGHPQVLAWPVKHHGESDAAFDVSDNGVLVYRLAEDRPSTRLALYNRRGRELREIARAGYYRSPRFSPDGRRLAVERHATGTANADIWLYDLDRGGAMRLTTTEAAEMSPVWSPDGRRIAYSSREREVYDIYTKAVDATSPATLVDSSPGSKLVEHWSPDAGTLLATIDRSGLWLLPLATDARSTLVRPAPVTPHHMQSEFSPDGRWVAYVSSDSQTPEVYVEPVPPTGARWQVSVNGGFEPHWSRGGRELIYLSPACQLLAVAVLPGEGWRAGPPHELFNPIVTELAGPVDIAVSPDGETILVNTPVDGFTIPPVQVVVNWTGMLKPR